MQGDESLEVDGAAAGDARKAFGRLGIVAVFRHRDDLAACSGGEKKLGDVRREADDALRRDGERDSLAIGVDRAHLGKRGESWQHEKEREG